MKLTQFELKVLKHISNHASGISRAKLIQKYKRHNITHAIERLLSCGYIDCSCLPYLSDNGSCSMPMPEETLYSISDEGLVEIESHKFFTFENVFQHLIAPIIVGVLSALITALILA